jgi:predicted amidophosphoribosyltransferase
MHPERLAERGFNQTAAIASMLRWELGIPTREALERTSFTVPQVGLTRNERLQNLKGVFCVSKPQGKDSICGRRIWIVDDVITTGATLEACALALHEAGAEKVYCLTLAAGIEKNTIQFNQSMV